MFAYIDVVRIKDKEIKDMVRRHRGRNAIFCIFPEYDSTVVQRVYITYAAPDAYAHTNQNKITKLNHIFEFTCGVFSLDL